VSDDARTAWHERIIPVLGLKRVRTQVSVSGFTRPQVEDGLQSLRDEFAERPWLLAADARWDEERQRLVVTIEREGNSLEVHGGATGATLDEVWDCVIACFCDTEGSISFAVDASDFV